MRTTIAAAALLTALAACGGDDGSYSMTEPNQIAICDGAPADRLEFVGTWDLDWGCMGTSSPSGFVECDPDRFPFAGVDHLVLAASSDPTKLHITLGNIDGESAYASGDDGLGHMSNSASLPVGSIGGFLKSCGDRPWYLEITVFGASDSVTWSADATLR